MVWRLASVSQASVPDFPVRRIRTPGKRRRNAALRTWKCRASGGYTGQGPRQSSGERRTCPARCRATRLTDSLSCLPCRSGLLDQLAEWDARIAELEARRCDGIVDVHAAVRP